MDDFTGKITKVLADYTRPLIQPQIYISLKIEDIFEITHLLPCHQKRKLRLPYLVLPTLGNGTLGKKKKKNGTKGPSSQIPLSIFPFTQGIEKCSSFAFFVSITLTMWNLGHQKL